MIILDTDVLSALMKRRPDPAVVLWLDAQSSESIWTTAVSVFEVGFGLELLAKGRRRQHLEAAFGHVLEDDLEGRILSLDVEAAQEASLRAAARRRVGRSVDFRDILIAGIAASRRATLATGNDRHFGDLGVHLVNPWAVAL